MNRLVLCICSRRKRQDGLPLHMLPVTMADGRRARQFTPIHPALHQLRDDVRHWALPSLPRGPEFVDPLDENMADDTGLYLPARSRYTGSFYDRNLLLPDVWNTSHKHWHVLIFSGLYGFLRPSEEIQNYELHISHVKAREVWYEHATDILADYITKQNITEVLNLMADPLYEAVINWAHIDSGGHKVLAGAELLPYYEIGRAHV